MAELQGGEVEDLARERLMQILIEDVRGGLFEGGLYGILLSEGWESTLKEIHTTKMCVAKLEGFYLCPGFLISASKQPSRWCWSFAAFASATVP